MTSPLSGATLAAQRAANRWKKYYLAISRPNVIFTALINGTPATLDGVVQLTYDGGTGDYTDVKPGMTCYISAVGYGEREIGVVRVRKSLEATIAYIGRTSGIQFADNQYLTFVDDFGLYKKEPSITNGSYYIDEDIVFNTTASFAPIIRIGPPALVLELTGADVSFTHDAPTIYSPTGQTIESYLWLAPGATIDNDAIATPAFTYDTPGEYYLSCTVTDSAGASSTRYQKIFVNPISAIIGTPDISGDVDSGGWSCKIEGHSGSSALDYHTPTSTRARDTNVSTLTFSRPHGLINGDTISVRDMGDVTYNAEDVVITVIDGSTLTYPNAGDDEDETADTAGFIQAVSLINMMDVSELRDKALCVLWKRDYVGTARDTSYGPYTSAENIRLAGWIDKQSLEINPQFGTFEFTIGGPAYWLDKITGAPLTVTDAAIATDWNQMVDLDTDKALYRLIKWQSTLTDITDVTLTGNTIPIKLANVNTGSLRNQIDGLAGEKLLARSECNRFGCMRVYIPQPLQDSSGKAGLVVLWDVLKSDLSEKIGFDRNAAQSASMVEVGGKYWDGTNEFQVFSRAPGNTNDDYGSPNSQYTELAVNTQDDIDRLAGDIFAFDNTQYPTVDIVLHWANDFVDIDQGYIIRMSVASTDTPRGVVWVDKRFVPESISYQFDESTGAESTTITLAEETTGIDGIDYYPPPVGQEINTAIPKVNVTVPKIPLASGWLPGFISAAPVTNGCGYYAPLNQFAITFSPTTLTGLDPVLSSFCYYKCKLRPSTAFYGASYIAVRITYYGDSNGNIAAYAVDASKNRIATLNISAPPGAGNNGDTLLTYAGVSELDVAGFEIVLTAGGAIDYFILGNELNAGSVAANDSVGVEITAPLASGFYYAVEGFGGPWVGGPTFPNNYGFCLGSAGSKDGWVGYDSGPHTFRLDKSAVAYSAERINSVLGRQYFVYSGTPVYYACGWDPNYSDNSGSFGYIVRSVSAVGVRRIVISNVIVHNVCTAA